MTYKHSPAAALDLYVCICSTMRQISSLQAQDLPRNTDNIIEISQVEIEACIEASQVRRLCDNIVAYGSGLTLCHFDSVDL